MDPLARRLGLTEVEVTQLGFGGAGLRDLFEVIHEAQAAATLEAAWDAGIRYYDTAPWYGLTQNGKGTRIDRALIDPRPRRRGDRVRLAEWPLRVDCGPSCIARKIGCSG
jgi:aryl-alcohol dehydrogenase-like predicted oxidoreductase